MNISFQLACTVFRDTSHWIPKTRSTLPMEKEKKSSVIFNLGYAKDDAFWDMADSLLGSRGKVEYELGLLSLKELDVLGLLAVPACALRTATSAARASRALSLEAMEDNCCARLSGFYEGEDVSLWDKRVYEKRMIALTANGLAALTLGGEMLGLGVGCQMKGLLKGDLDLDTAYGAMLGRVLENFGLTALTVLAAVVSTGLNLEGAAAETLCKGNLE
nr:hypothetical protein [Tanacetum cinerariifolium]